MKKLKNKVKKMMTVVMMACMLLTVVAVSSDEGVMPYGDLIVDIEVSD